MVIEDFEKGLLALVCWREARGDGIEAMLAVAHVIHNRVKAWGKSYCEVIDGHDQFSSMTIAGDSQLLVWPDVRNPLFVQLLQKLDDAYAGTGDDLTKGSIYYGNLANVTSGWFKSEIVGKPDQHPMKAIIGKQHFFG
jgi:spore germination cell wall hydrolase CwlJ-like protein